MGILVEVHLYGFAIGAIIRRRARRTDAANVNGLAALYAISLNVSGG